MTAMERSNNATRLPRRTIVKYAIGSIGTGGFATLPGLVILIYLTDFLGVSVFFAGALVLVAKIWDVIIDPVIGNLSDRSLSQVGSRRPVMVLGAVLLPVFFILTFVVPVGIPPLVAGIWVLVAFVLAATAFSMFQVPYIALPAELTENYDERTRLLTWRVFVLSLAILLFGAGGPAIREAAGGDKSFTGYLVMAVVAGLAIGIGLFASSFVAKKATVPRSAGRPGSLKDGYVEGFRAIQRSQPFRALLLTFLLQGLATGAMLAGANYVGKYVLKDADAVIFLFVALIAPALLCAPLWGAIANRIGKERAFGIASVIFGVAALSLVILIWAPGIWVYIPVAFAGAAYAGMQSLPMAMLPDVISDDAVKHGDGQAGVFGGVWTAGETTGMTLGATAFAMLLGFAGFIESAAPVVVEQPPSAIAGIAIAFSVLPAAMIGLSLLSLARYRLRKGTIGR